MIYDKAKQLHKEQWLQGKHKGTGTTYVFPYNSFHEDEEFIKEEILIRELEFLRSRRR